MKIPFFLRRKRNIINSENIETQEISIDNTTIRDEKEEDLSKLNQEKLNYFFAVYNLDKESISMNFVKILVNNPNLFIYLTEDFIGRDIVSKINNNSLRVSDINEYDKELFMYDIFVDEDRELLNILRSEVTLADKIYTYVTFEDFEKQINSNQFIDITVHSFFDDELLVDKHKAIPLNEDRIFFDNSVDVATTLEEDKLFSLNIFDRYYSGDFSFNGDNILFISYQDFLDWSKNENKLNILKKSQVFIKDNVDKFFELTHDIDLRASKYCKNYLFVNNNDEFIIKINHLLYLIDNSELNVKDKELFRYKVAKTFNMTKKYFIGSEITEIITSVKEILGTEQIKELTSKFNQLDKERKLKEIASPQFSVSIFLRQFDNLGEVSAFELLNYISKLTKDEKKQVLESGIVINKLQGLLKESEKNEYLYYQKFMEVLDTSDICKIFNADFIKKFYANNRFSNQYRFFYVLLEKDVNEALEIFLKDDKYFDELVKDIERYNFKDLEYSRLVSVIKKFDEKDFDADFSFLSTVKEAYQFELLKENVSDETLVKIVASSNKKVQQFFYLEDKRFNYLYDKFNIIDLVTSGYKFSDDVISQKNFFDKLKSSSLVQFRINVNQFMIHQPNIFFEEKFIEYEKELISSYDEISGMFKQYNYLLDNINLLDDRRFINNGIDFFYDKDMNCEIRKYISYDDNDKIFIKDKEGIINYLQELSKLKLNEVIVDILFQDNIYNVFLNINEMLRFNKRLDESERVIDQDQIDFYETILNLDRMNKGTIMEIYNNFKDKNIALMFYEDLRKTKNKCYDKIKSELFQIEETPYKIDKAKSLKYGVPVYDLRDKEYVILARCLNSRYGECTNNKRDCYTLLSNENSNVFYRDNYIYGYSGFNNDCVLHMFEGDSYSGDVKWSELNAGSDRVNRIMTAREIATNSYMYSEVQIVNKNSESNNRMFEALRPSFLIVFDEIDEKILEEAKRRNIPICIISNSRDMTLEGIIRYNEMLDKYTHERWIINENERRKNR